MACTQWSNPCCPLLWPHPPGSPGRHCCSPCALATVAKTRSLIISSKAKDKPDQATRQTGKRDNGQTGRTTLGPGCKLTPSLLGLPRPLFASFLAFCVISLKTKTENGRRTMVKRNPAHSPLGTVHAVHASVLANCCCLWHQRRRRRRQRRRQRRRRRRPHVPQRLINL